jgi:hypothetical protein
MRWCQFAPATLAFVLVAALATSARASTGVCDVDLTSQATCTAQIQNAGTVVNDIFRDSQNRTGAQLPTFGQVYNAWPGCNLPSAGCAGTSLPPYDCPGQYSCASVANTLVNASAYLNQLDRQWWQPCRLSDHTLDANGCPKFGTCIADGVGGSYFPWEGLVFDLQGPSNKVALFAENDHGPQPCESLEYSVYLSDNPLARAAITDPLVSGVDPAKWNRAVLSKIYTKGFVEVRPPDPAGHGATCGDTATFSVEEDSFVQVFSLPCGITFRYAAIVAGNDALDFPGCGYDSSEAEVDAVAGLTEDGAGVCPDRDGDHFVDCTCPNAPPVCDCNDSDPAIHPGAPEACDSPDLNCDLQPGACSGALVCYDSVCREACTGEFCGNGDACVVTPAGQLCLPSSCAQGGCPPGQTCISGQCESSCTGVACPAGQTCQDGNCIDPCANVVCPAGQACAAGACAAPCTCLQGDLGCAAQAGTVCASNGTCVPTACAGVTCTGSMTCDPSTGTCVPQCAGVTCPFGQTCVEGSGCVPRCNGVACTGTEVCDPADGACKDPGCIGVACTGGLVCIGGTCVDTDGGLLPDAGAAGADAAERDGMTGGTPAKGCCDVSGGAPGGGSMLLGTGVVALLIRRRRRAR